MKKLLRYLLQGVLYTAPLVITIYILYVIFEFIDGNIQQWLTEIIDIRIPGLGLVILIVLLVFIGFIGQTIIAKPIKSLFNRFLKKVPFLKVVYSAFTDLFSAFIGKERKFNKPVVVRVNITSNLEKLGFVTKEDLSLLKEKDKVTVYFPHSYNWSGELFIVPRDQVRPIDIPPAEVMKFIISAGVADWD